MSEINQEYLARTLSYYGGTGVLLGFLQITSSEACAQNTPEESFTGSGNVVR